MPRVGGGPRQQSDLASCWRLDLAIDDDTFVGSHPSKNPLAHVRRSDDGAGVRGGGPDAGPRSAAGALSAHFIAGGDTEKDLEFQVVRLRDERRFANRRVDVMQDGVLLATAMVSFLDGGRGLEHGVEAPEVPDPLSLPKIDDLLRGYEETVPQFVEALRADRMAVHERPGLGDARQGRKARPQPGVAEGRRARCRTTRCCTPPPWCTASDTTVLDSIITTHGLSWGYDRIFAATVNHSVWFHRPIRFDEWVLYSTTSPVAADSRGLGTGHFFDQSGQIVATVVQEGIIKYFPGA